MALFNAAIRYSTSFFCFSATQGFYFLNGYSDRIVCGLVGGFLLLAGVMNIFRQRKIMNTQKGAIALGPIRKYF